MQKSLVINDWIVMGMEVLVIAYLAELGKNVLKVKNDSIWNERMILYGYNFFVIDHHWGYLTPLNEFFKKILDTDFSQSDCTANEELMAATRRWYYAKELAEKIGWEYDFTRGPYVFFLPDPQGMCIEYGFMFKQYNNGRTFIISPFELDYMDRYEDVVKDWIDTDENNA
ncbi:hypothetical protein MMO39_10280 [Acinetobacter modestus]|uniref:hypothetical protein n=1 Tax=Acinetobacter modestus TaxID=1776740 RepID=UPI001F4B1D89|nr:hypothetical protein [Acinetobacter modestus]MCH7387683.1 hypothetical protein [Acinetobacter modestus]